ncbi:hypothetical protein KBA41_04585 [Candidatus Ozemobacteraceae bacterium]|nr:hypothetical protein [Candidatus Ozemobacteraceae bacterium]
MTSKNDRPWLRGLMVLLFLGGVAMACELPAEPAAAIVPDINELNSGKVKIVNNDNGTFDFLVPDNTQLKMHIVWDPYDHNGGKLEEKYEWVHRSDKGNIPFDPNVPVTQEHGYFPLSAMAEFFTVTGNRNSIIEAFNRANGGSIEGNKFMSDNSMGPKILLTNAFVKPGQQGKITILDDKRAADYPMTSTLCSPSGSDLGVNKIDEILPNDGADFSTKTLDPPFDFEKDSKKYRKYVQYVFGKSGIYMGELNIGISELKSEDYKAYIVAGPPNVWMGNSLPVLAEGTNGGEGNETGIINVKFPTPTLGATEPVRLKVNAPAAGFVITNLFWCWEESVTVKVASDTNDDGELDTYVHDSSDSNCGVAIHKCSVGLKVTVVKPSSGSGYSAFRVYSTRPPITSNLELTEPTKKFSCGDMGISIPFKLTVYGTDPFANIKLLERRDSDNNVINLKHDIPEMLSSLKLFMSYPVYKFHKVNGLVVNDFYNLRKINLGLLRFQDPAAPSWTGTYYEPKWIWLAGTSNITNASFSTLMADGSDALGGGYWIIEGTADFDVPVPQHFSNDDESEGKTVPYLAHGAVEYPAPGQPEPDNLWKLFAVVKDTSGHESVSYSSICNSIQQDFPVNFTTTSTSAGQVLLDGVVLPSDSGSVLKTSYNQSPPLVTRIPDDDDDPDNEYTWQKYVYPTCVDDKIPPEIQLIVFDSRNNRYHIFATDKGGDGKLTKDMNDAPDAGPSPKAYAQAKPYSPSDVATITEGLKFEAFNESLYSRFIDENKVGGASTLNEPALEGKGFVCQTNTRLIFYIRAWDNVNTFAESKTFGVKEISYEVKDENAASADRPPKSDPEFIAYNPGTLMTDPILWQFRAPNVVGSSPDGKECSITVQAKDFSGLVQKLTLKIFVVGHDLTIRSLEEKRNRN